MRHLRKNNLVLGLLLTAVLGLTVLFIGGEYLHAHLHKHESQADHQHCPITQLQTQVFTAVAVLPVTLIWSAVWAGVFRPSLPFVFQPSYFLPDSHAPPLSFL